MLTKEELREDSYVFTNINGWTPAEIQERVTSREARQLLADARCERFSVRSLRALIKRAGWQPAYLAEMNRHELLKFIRDMQEETK